MTWLGTLSAHRQVKESFLTKNMFFFLKFCVLGISWRFFRSRIYKMDRYCDLFVWQFTTVIGVKKYVIACDQEFNTFKPMLTVDVLPIFPMCPPERNCTYHDDVIKWIHFPRYWPFCAGNSPVTGECPARRPVTRSFNILFDLLLDKRLS